MLSLLLAQKIASLFLIMAMGFILVRVGLLKSKDAHPLSVAAIYVVNPCMIVTAFQVNKDPNVVGGFLIALAAGFIIQIGFIVLAWLFGKALRFTSIEKASLIYTNCGNLIIPLVAMVFGDDMVIYTTAYLVSQTIFMWSHGKSLVQGKPSISLRDMFLSINMIAVYVGLALFATGLRLPGPVYSAVSLVGNMIGPLAMLITGIIMGGMSFAALKSFKRLPLVAAFRLVVFPLCALLFLKFSPLGSLVPNGQMVLAISLLAAAAPSASNINQMAQIWADDADYASAINVVTILCCIVTMPLMLALYQM